MTELEMRDMIHPPCRKERQLPRDTILRNEVLLS